MLVSLSSGSGCTRDGYGAEGVRSFPQVFGKPLIEQPVIREKLAQMFAGVETCTQMLYDARRARKPASDVGVVGAIGRE